MIMTETIGRFLVATGAIIENTDDGNILLLKRSGAKDFSPDIWEYPTGRMRQFEEPQDGLRREIMEETGLDVEIVKPISVYHIFRGERTAENELIGVMFWCRTDRDVPTISDEHSDFIWVSAERALQMIQKPSMQADIRAFIYERQRHL
jgi:8-oxo-dGTP diphosphatase